MNNVDLSLEVAFLKSNFQDFNKFVKYYTQKSKISRKKGSDFIESLKKECFFCSSTEKLDFLHKNPLTKRHAVNQMAKHSEKTIQKEVDKCWCVCSTCKYRLNHRLLTPLPEFLT